MKNTISKRDWETISAYLDGQLSRRKQAHLESRLNSDPQLQIMFDKLRVTRQVLRSAPRLRVPRSFMLTPEMAGNPVRVPRLAPVFGWASAIASFLLVLVLAGDFISGAGFIPNELITAQNEMVSELGELAESDAIAQPVANDELSMSSKSSVDNIGEVTPLEMADEPVYKDIAAEPALESVLKEEATLESQEVEISAVSEDPNPEEAEGLAAVTTQGDATLESPSEIPAEGSDIESDEPVDEFDTAEQSAAIMVERSMVTETIETGNVQQQPSEMVVEEEISGQTLENQPEQSSVFIAETPTIAESLAQKVEQPSAETEIQIDAEPTFDITVNDFETSSTEMLIPNKTSDMVLGIEVILALGAIGTGLAWVYIRRRGG